MKVTDTPVTFAETAPTLAALGWRPIPLVASTKVPAEPGWQARNLTPWPPGELEQVVAYHGDCACGLAIPGANMALDCDITDADRAGEVGALAAKHLGTTPLVRIGQAPKWVRVYRAAEPLGSTKPHPLEIYCGSGQIAAFGIHSKTGRPYAWPLESPLEVPANSADLPLVTAQALRKFLSSCDPVLADLRRARRHQGGAGIGLDAGEHLRRLMDRGLSFRRAAQRVLQGADGGGRHYAVRAVISIGYNLGYSADQIAALIERHAPAELLELVTSDGYLERTLGDYVPRQSGWGGVAP
jgi:hypothetical protein